MSQNASNNEKISENVLGLLNISWGENVKARVLRGRSGRRIQALVKALRVVGTREPEFDRKLVGGRSRTDGVPRH